MDASAKGPYCHRCGDGRGGLLPYDEVLARLAREEFMGRNGMSKEQAETAARNAMMHMPAWRGRG